MINWHCWVFLCNRSNQIPSAAKLITWQFLQRIQPALPPLWSSFAHYSLPSYKTPICYSSDVVTPSVWSILPDTSKDMPAPTGLVAITDPTSAFSALVLLLFFLKMLHFLLYRPKSLLQQWLWCSWLWSLRWNHCHSFLLSTGMKPSKICFYLRSHWSENGCYFLGSDWPTSTERLVSLWHRVSDSVGILR